MPMVADPMVADGDCPDEALFTRRQMKKTPIMPQRKTPFTTQSNKSDRRQYRAFFAITS